MRKGRIRLLWLVVAAVLVAAVIVPVYFSVRSGGKLVLTGGKRVLLVGDSLTVQSAPVSSSRLEAKGYDVHVVAIPASGLLDTDPGINWPARFKNLVATFDPNTVVVEFIGNYGYFGLRPGVVDGSPTFYRQWAGAAQNAENVLASRHAVVYWVVGPPVEQAAEETQVMSVDRIYAHLKVPNAQNGAPPTIDMVTPFAGPDGQYTPSKVGAKGRVAQLRTPDGTHLTAAGQLLFGETVAEGVSRGRPDPR
jgi:hypothetical protein